MSPTEGVKARVKTVNHRVWKEFIALNVPTFTHRSIECRKSTVDSETINALVIARCCTSSFSSFLLLPTTGSEFRHLGSSAAAATPNIE